MERKYCRYFLLLMFVFTFSLCFSNSTDNPISTQITEESTKSNIESLQFPLASAWLPNGTPVCTEGNYQSMESICSDEAGGVIIAWKDNRTAIPNPIYEETNISVYVQKINSTGDVQWDTDGVPICIITNYYEPEPQICSDGLGGAIITWVDNRSGNKDIYAQAVDTDGNPKWDINGIEVCTLGSDQWYPQIISNVGNGAIIVWLDERNGMGNPDIYAQAVDSAGDTLWLNNGKEVCTDGSNQYRPHVCTDGNGGAIIAWYDDRLGFSNYAVYAQRIDQMGALRWTPSDGLPICTIVNTYEVLPRICSDENDGAIIAWSDNRTGGVDMYSDIYAQRVDSDGISLWPDNGTAVCTYDFKQRVSDIQSDGTGGAFIVWDDYRTYIASEQDIFAQKINSTGHVQWNPDGAPICTEIAEQDKPQICIDGIGGALFVWSDERSEIHSEKDIYAQYVNSQGQIQWNSNGEVICNENDYQGFPLIVSNGTSGAIIAWNDGRDENRDIYAQRVGFEAKVETPTYSLCLDIIKQFYSEDEFNFTIYLYNASDVNHGINWGEIINWSIWWNGINVSANITSLGGGDYSLSLEPITVSPVEDPIRLNGTILANGFKEKEFEYFIAVDPEVIDKAPKSSIPPPSDGGGGGTKKDEEPIIPDEGLVAIGVVSVIAVVAIVIVLLKRRGLPKRESV